MCDPIPAAPRQQHACAWWTTLDSLAAVVAAAPHVPWHALHTVAADFMLLVSAASPRDRSSNTKEPKPAWVLVDAPRAWQPAVYNVPALLAVVAAAPHTAAVAVAHRAPAPRPVHELAVAFAAICESHALSTAEKFACAAAVERTHTMAATRQPYAWTARVESVRSAPATWRDPLLFSPPPAVRVVARVNYNHNPATCCCCAAVACDGTPYVPACHRCDRARALRVLLAPPSGTVGTRMFACMLVC